MRIEGLEPGKRYFYRVWDPEVTPSSREKTYGAKDGWRREYAVATLSPDGQRTVVRVPIKVLLMTNVINLDSVKADTVQPAKFTEEEIEFVKSEFAKTARFLFVNSGMRYWADFHFFIDDRWQRWSEEPDGIAGFYKGWIPCRSWPEQDYLGPGGGTFTFVDVENIEQVGKVPIFEETPYPHQMEISMPRRWTANGWEFYTSGGGTYGIDNYPNGFPGRSQFLGGGDLAWLSTHEFHHQMESMGMFSLSYREDDRIVFNHYSPRKPESPWSTSGRHGEHWRGMVWWDRQMTDAQWLRVYFGSIVSVVDADMDGVPDDDPRLPFDEKRFGSDPTVFTYLRHMEGVLASF